MSDEIKNAGRKGRILMWVLIYAFTFIMLLIWVYLYNQRYLPQ